MEYLIKKQINKKINFKNFNKKIVLNTKNIKNALNSEKYNVKHINFQKNSINGIAKKYNDKCFFKILDKKEFENEIQGYMKIKDSLPVNSIEQILEFNNYFVIVYKYEKTIKKNNGLLNDFLVQNDVKIKKGSRQKMHKIINAYEKIFQNTIFNDEYPMQQFFDGRIDSRLVKWYEHQDFFDYNISINGKVSKTTNEIIKEVINFYSNKKMYMCALSQGDPNTLNIGMKPIFFDFATSGYNPIICELATIFWSVIIADAYFCPKYHPKSYFGHENVFKNIPMFNPKIDYEIDKESKEINIQSNFVTSEIRKIFILEYIKMLKKIDIEINKELIYFLIMRVLCVFNLNEMEDQDFFYSIFILHFLYKNISDDGYKSLNDIIEKLKIIGDK